MGQHGTQQGTGGDQYDAAVRYGYRFPIFRNGTGGRGLGPERNGTEDGTQGGGVKTRIALPAGWNVAKA